MPNWCENNLTIYCKNTKETKEYLQNLITQARNGKLNEFIIPFSDMGNKEWDYDSCCEFWGTKWDIDYMGDDESINENNISITISYLTAWSPNIPVLEKLYKKLCELDEEVTVESNYEEPGMNYCGRFINGSDEAYEIGIAHRILNDNLEIVDIVNADGKIKLSSNKDIFFIEKEREEGGDFSFIHDEHIQYEIIKCFSNYYDWGDGEVTLIKCDDEYYIM